MDFLAGLPLVSAGFLAFVFLLIVFQEAVNGFHDTANAVATVIYSNAMKPLPAVALAAFMNFLGVLLGGTAVAFGLVYMLPNPMIAGINSIESIALFLALIVSAVFLELRHLVAGHSQFDHAHVHRVDHRCLDGVCLRPRPAGPRTDQLAPGTKHSDHAGGVADRRVRPGRRDAETDFTVREGSGDVSPGDPSQAPPRVGHVESRPGVDTSGRSPLSGSRRHDRHPPAGFRAPRPARLPCDGRGWQRRWGRT